MAGKTNDFVGVLYDDLVSKACIDTHATVTIIEALEEVLGGAAPDDVLTITDLSDAGLVLPGKSPYALLEAFSDWNKVCVDSTRREALKPIIALRDSLYRFHCLEYPIP